MRLFACLKSWLRPDPADALKGAEDEKLLWEARADLAVTTALWLAAIPLAQEAMRSALQEAAHRRQAEANSSTPQHPNNQPLADPLGSEDATSVPNDLHDV